MVTPIQTKCYENYDLGGDSPAFPDSLFTDGGPAALGIEYFVKHFGLGTETPIIAPSLEGRVASRTAPSPAPVGLPTRCYPPPEIMILQHPPIFYWASPEHMGYVPGPYMPMRYYAPPPYGFYPPSYLPECYGYTPGYYSPHSMIGAGEPEAGFIPMAPDCDSPLAGGASPSLTLTTPSSGTPSPIYRPPQHSERRERPAAIAIPPEGTSRGPRSAPLARQAASPTPPSSSSPLFEGAQKGGREEVPGPRRPRRGVRGSRRGRGLPPGTPPAPSPRGRAFHGSASSPDTRSAAPSARGRR